MITFTEEERCIIDIYKDKSRLHTVAKMYEALPYIETDEILALVSSAIDKLIRIDDRRYRLMMKNQSYLALAAKE